MIHLRYSVSTSTLTVGEAVVLVAREGLPEVEYALFDPAEIELHATEPGTIREMGYRTTVGAARQRLAALGYDASTAGRLVSAIPPAALRAWSRSAAARLLVDRLEPTEVLEVSSFEAAGGGYVGTWLDFSLIAADVGLPRAAASLRAALLAAVLASEPLEDAPVRLLTAEVTAQRRPGERTWRRTALDEPAALRDALAAAKPRARPAAASGGAGAGPTRVELLAWLRERAARDPAGAARLATLEPLLTTREAPTRGPLAETALWTVESKLARGETAGVAEQIDAIERRRGRVPGTIYLRARLALATNSEPAATIAARVAELSTSMAAFHELQLLAAQSWLAAGDARRARAFARDLLDNTGADDVLRTMALEVLERAGASSANLAPGGAPAHVPPIEPAPVLSVPARAPAPSETPAARSPADVHIPPPPRPPSPDLALELPSQPRTSTRPGFPASSGTAGASSTASRSSASMRSLPPGTSLPPYRVEPRGDRVWSSPPPLPHEVEVELVESLSLPPGVRAEPPPTDEPPRSAPAARIACTLLARELGRELRARHGVALRLDLDGLETAQRYLRETLVDGRLRTPDENREVMRHGAFLSELLARHLGGRWADVESTEAGRWAMLVPSRSRPDEVARVWPFARVLRFVAMGHRERDLVSYYLELESRGR